MVVETARLVLHVLPNKQYVSGLAYDEARREGGEPKERAMPREGETRGEEEHAVASLAAAIAAASAGEEGDDTDTMVMGLGGRFFE